MRTILPKYLKGFPEASTVRSRLVRATSWEEIESLLEGTAAADG
jgi:tRNA-dihydrouridine synthase